MKLVKYLSLFLSMFGIQSNVQGIEDVRFGPNSGTSLEELIAANASGRFRNNYRGKIGGFVDYLCPTFEDSLTFGKCRQECTLNHGTDGGTCGDVSQGDYNCYCAPRSKKWGENHHCMDENDDHRHFCNQDCICNHASQGGHCEWDTKTCVCDGQRLNLGNAGCLSDNWHDFQHYGHSKIGHKGFSFMDDAYHWFIKGDRPLPPLLTNPPQN